MNAVPILLLLSASVALGFFLGWRYLRQVRSKPAWGAVHLMFGVGGLELMVMLRRASPDAEAISADTLGTAAAFLLAMAMMSGLLSPVIGRHWRRKAGGFALAIHAAVGAAGFGLFVAWFLTL